MDGEKSIYQRRGDVKYGRERAKKILDTKQFQLRFLSTGFMSRWCTKSIQKFTVLLERLSTVENLIYRPSKEGFFISLLVNNKSVICYGSMYCRIFSLPNAVYV